MLALTVGGRQTTALVTANNPHSESNDRRVAADDVKTGLFVQVRGPGTRTAKISDPHRTGLTATQWVKRGPPQVPVMIEAPHKVFE